MALKDFVDAATIISGVATAATAIVAVWAIFAPWRYYNNQGLLEQAVLSLERAYEALTNDGKDVKPPLPNRLNWLTAARHIQRYKVLKSKIKSNIHRLICEEHEEYWRHQFYLCLDARNIKPNYYEEARFPRTEERDGIEPRSALVVHSFAEWPEGREDPMDLVNISALVREAGPLRGSYGLRYYLEEKYPRLWTEFNEAIK